MMADTQEDADCVTGIETETTAATVADRDAAATAALSRKQRKRGGHTGTVTRLAAYVVDTMEASLINYDRLSLYKRINADRKDGNSNSTGR